jgi:hypothetical protein
MVSLTVKSAIVQKETAGTNAGKEKSASIANKSERGCMPPDQGMADLMTSPRLLQAQIASNAPGVMLENSVYTGSPKGHSLSKIRVFQRQNNGKLKEAAIFFKKMKQSSRKHRQIFSFSQRSCIKTYQAFIQSTYCIISNDFLPIPAAA